MYRSGIINHALSKPKEVTEPEQKKETKAVNKVKRSLLVPDMNPLNNFDLNHLNF